MQIDLVHKGGLKFVAHDEMGFEVSTDASPSIGGEDQGFRPMELFLIALASCTSIDTILILNKSQKNYRGYRVKVEGKRREKIPQIFTEITLVFSLESEDISVDILHRAVSLSLTKYCSVAEMISFETIIRAQVELNSVVDPRVIEKNPTNR